MFGKDCEDRSHEHHIPLIVDEAHGAHFRYFPTIFRYQQQKLGADVVVQSFHKTMPSMTQTAVLHNCSDRVDGTELIRQIYGNLSDQQSVLYSYGKYGCLHRKDGKRRTSDVSGFYQNS